MSDWFWNNYFIIYSSQQFSIKFFVFINFYYTFNFIYVSNLFTVEAATKIQAAFRGHKARAKMKQGDAKDNENGAEREPTKEELEAEFDLNDKGKSKSWKYATSRMCVWVGVEINEWNGM